MGTLEEAKIFSFIGPFPVLPALFMIFPAFQPARSEEETSDACKIPGKHFQHSERTRENRGTSDTYETLALLDQNVQNLYFR